MVVWVRETLNAMQWKYKRNWQCQNVFFEFLSELYELYDSPTKVEKILQLDTWDIKSHHLKNTTKDKKNKL